MVTAGSELTPGMSVDRRYRIQCTLGRGGFGRTYLASDERRFNELCVLKEFVPNSQADPVVCQKLRELFQREAAILHKLNHPQIPKFFAGFEEDNRLFIAQEYIDGKTYWRLLQERQRQGKPFSQPEIIEWLHDLLQVLDYLHSQNIVHRDISPDNIMLPRGHKTPVLIDFGVVKQMLPHLHAAHPNDLDDLIQASVSVGKFGYAPYEQIRMGQCSPRSDLYALAVTAVVLLTGKPPNLLIDSKSLEWQWKRWLHLDPRLTQILDTMMSDKPQDRFASAQVVLQALQPLYEALDSLTLTAEAPATIHYLPTAQSVKPSGSLKPSAEPSPAPRQNDQDRTQLTALTGSVETQLDVAAGADSVLDAADHADNNHADNTETPTRIEATTYAGRASTSLHPAAWSLTATIVPDLRPLSLRSRLEAVRAVVLRLPQDQLGNSRRAQRPSARQILVLGMLTLLPISGAMVGVQSPYIASLCWAFSNCANDQESQVRYQQAIEQADSASILTTQARTLNDLQMARQRLADSISQLNAFSGATRVYTAANAVLPKYESLLRTLDQLLEKETRATQLLNRAEAEAQKATEQTKIAKTLQQYETAQLQWRRALATLAAIPNGTFIYRQATSRMQEYRARLDTVNLKVAAATPTPRPTPAATVTATSAIPATSTSSTAAASGQTQPASSQRPQTVSIAAAVPAPNRSQTASATVPAPKPAQPSRSARATRRPVPQTAPARSQPPSSPLEIDSRWIAGSLITSATQTLDNVAIWIDGTRTEADGKFVATLWIQNRSRRGFGFVPLYAESRDQNGHTLRSRVLFTGTTKMMLEPGEALNGQIYLLDRPASTQRLTLVIQESTNGERTFRIPF